VSNFNKRLLTGVLFVIVLLGSIYQSELASSILFTTIILLCQREFYAFFKASEVKPQSLVGILGGLGFFLASAVAFRTDLTFNTLFLIVPLIFIVFVFVFELFRNSKDPIANIGYTILGIIYIAVPFTLLHQISYYTNFQFGDTYNYDVLIGYFFILWANDTGAYMVGRKFGKTKLFERISPKKTWEGSLGGVFFGLLFGYINAQLFDGLDTITWMILALIVVVFGSLGDLVESLFKRSLGIKDSGKILPGHGGVLDRFDGIFISAPMVYAFLKILSIW
tara:strand:+ start:51882 stop:52718 length:837 start_codon:yes stop_codon:yes gene_type:complete